MARPVEKVSSQFVPAHPGSYALLLVLAGEACIAVGHLGEFVFQPGQYLYLGSAWGSGGLRARLGHHLRSISTPHWHIDWLRRSVALSEIWYSTHLVRLECAWSQRLLCLPGAFTPAPSFGASDCRSGCAAHLVGLPSGTPSGIIEDRLCSIGSGVKLYSVAIPVDAAG
jgi:Uri superfamily endonuclease